MRIRAVFDSFTQKNLTLVVDKALLGVRVARELDAINAIAGKPLTIVSDNRTWQTSAGSADRVLLRRVGQATAEWPPQEQQLLLAGRTPERDCCSHC
ncbi:hypothetical protein [Sphingomonas pruni]|uniref:hypothetical protein n=1 Tax=Sphingomonas pruni TaxID=40683 RepID=UPI000A9F4DC8|nr:hypothetical protein [Sphingomonas pruni]